MRPLPSEPAKIRTDAGFARFVLYADVFSCLMKVVETFLKIDYTVGSKERFALFMIKEMENRRYGEER